ncbi:VapB-type antitoxin [Candidatus Acidianus copahuensis]|uniref:VapB-type antitoxin n=1 Tax=Candidatus Acidianus copahuensis TaxID=1160895 RepID=A0A031LU38_9CREN|nr:hypothetical protein [Candidatus Acidianus copahuensis]EZQ11341.1 VapB-type antitoxin [Candidatus Acidianus copahuensis]
MAKVESIKVKDETKMKLIKIAGELEKQYGRRFSIDEVINYLIDKSTLKPELLDSLFGSLKGVDLYNELLKERRLDEERSKRKFGY